LKVSATATAAVVVRHVGSHINEIFLPDYRLDRKSEVFGHWITKGFSHQLAGVLNREFYLQVLVPVGIYLELSFPDPFCIELNDAYYLEVMLNVEFFQSTLDCE